MNIPQLANKTTSKSKNSSGNIRIALIFFGVFVCLAIALPLAPFVLTYFLYDRFKTYQELKNNYKKRKKEKGLFDSMVNNWKKENE